MSKLFFLSILFFNLLFSTTCMSLKDKQLQNKCDSLEILNTSYEKEIQVLTDSLTILNHLISKNKNYNIIIDTSNSFLNPSVVRFKNTTFDVYIVDLRTQTIEFFFKDSKNVKLETFENVNNFIKERGDSLIFLTNGGMFDPQGEPVGAFYYQGKILKEVNIKEGNGNFYMKPNGVFLINDKNEAKILETNEFINLKDSVVFATQSGPMLVKDGIIHQSFNQGSENKYIRSGVGVINSYLIVFAISNEQINFYTFADLFKTYFGCQNALYLDGAISEFYQPKLERTSLDCGFFGVMIGVINNNK